MADSTDDGGFSIGWIPTLATAAGLALLLGLGGWQTSRYLQKSQQEVLRDRRLEKPPVRIESLDDLSPEEHNYRRAKLHGSIDTSTRIVVGHRHYNGDPGSWLVQPLHLAEDGGVLLVNRGWIPFQRADEKLDELARTPLEQPLVGLLYRLPNAVPDEDNRARLESGTMTIAGDRSDWDSFDATAIYRSLSEETPGGPWVLVLGPRHTGDRYPIASYEHVTEPYLTSTRHLSYAIFWYAVAVALVGIYLAAGFGALRRRRRGHGRVPGGEE